MGSLKIHFKVEPIGKTLVLGFATFPISNLFERLNMMHKASLAHTRTRYVTTCPHSEESRPEIQELAERKRGTQVEDDLLAPQ